MNHHTVWFKKSSFPLQRYRHHFLHVDQTPSGLRSPTVCFTERIYSMCVLTSSLICPHAGAPSSHTTVTERRC